MPAKKAPAKTAPAKKGGDKGERANKKAEVIAMMKRAKGVTLAEIDGALDQRGVDVPIDRRGPATILEQIEVCQRYLTPDVQALIIECMALKPEYQEVSERMIVRSTMTPIRPTTT